MNSDAQVEINMFLRATEMNQANINLGGFFDVNRTLFKSVSILYCWQMSVGISSQPGDIFSSFKKSSSSSLSIYASIIINIMPISFSFLSSSSLFTLDG
jgi:hypothetical protein